MTRPHISEVVALLRLRIRERVRIVRAKMPPGSLDAIALPAVLLIVLILLYVAAQIAVNSNFRSVFASVRHVPAYCKDMSIHNEHCILS